jgi:regulator of protease activity HflC (stomatin/prohibitin superfamily)
MWLDSLLEKITSFIPRIMIIRPDESGFRQIPKPWGGCWVTETKPGNWYWLLPIVMEEEVCRIKTQVKDIRIQSGWTKDGKDVAVGVSIRYYIQSPIKALLEVLDYDESVQNLVLGVVHDYVEEHTENELMESRSLLKDQLLKAIRDEASGWGLKIQSVKITDFGRANNIRILMDEGIKFKVSE